MRKRIDWQRLREDYSRGFSVEELSELYRCSPRTIRDRIRREGWKRHTECDREAGSLVKEHRRLWQEVKKRLSVGLNRGDEKELKLAKMAGDVLLSVIKGEKEVWNMDPADKTLTEEEINAVTREMESLTIPHGTETPVDRT